MKKNSLWSRILILAIISLSFGGCTPRSLYNDQYVSDEIGERSGFQLPDEPSDSVMLPSGVNPEDGLTVKEAVAVALWNNQQLKVDLAELGFARSDLMEAGMLPNPVFSFLFPLGPKQMEYTLSLAVEALWQRPRRVSAAKLNTEKVAENLVNHGLALVRDVYVSFADFNMALEKLSILEEEAALDKEIAEIALIRMQTGEINSMEEAALQLASSRTREVAISARRDMEIQKIIFLSNLGIISSFSDIQPSSDPVVLTIVPDPEFLIKTGLAFRPDLRAAELEIEIAGEKLGWERSKIFNLTAMLDANARSTNGFELGPGVSFEIPVFYFNQGGTSRAKTEIQRATDHYLLVQQSIRAEILQSYQGYMAARKSYELLVSDILPRAEQAVANGELSYLSGEISYLEFLTFKRQFLQTRLRFVEAEAEIRKNTAAIYYSIGGNMTPL